MPSVPSAGVSINSLLMFSLPNPLGKKVILISSPSTSSVCKWAGVLSPVFSRVSGSHMLLRKFPSAYARRTPSSTAMRSGFPVRCTSCPNSRKTMLMPVSWHTGIFSFCAHCSFFSTVVSANFAAPCSQRSASFKAFLHASVSVSPALRARRYTQFSIS